ncbi:MAG TPA: LLM class flavin-dependent oxidoreductase [Chitinophagaceae bacterium]
MRLSVLDQSPIRKDSNAREALLETVQLARFADDLGYTRFWVSEHHSTASLAGSTPEVLMAHLAGQTSRIRIGSGGVMLPHYSALKVAENFRMLETLFPGRIDLGVGRAPGGDRITAYVLNPANQFNEKDFVQQLLDLQAWLNDLSEEGTVHEKVKATPIAPSVPQQWILSSSGQSGIFAAHLGMAFGFAHFINPHGGSAAVQQYKDRFKPSINLQQPESLVAIFVFCSEDEEKVAQNRAVTAYRFLQLEKGRFDPVTYEEVKGVEHTPYELSRIEANSPRFVMGTPPQVKEQLEGLAAAYGVEEIMVANIALSFEDRLRSYELLAEMFLEN